ncbi:hypothetical protein OPIT5_08250 [Opitutaceae bacterium TAV5]|nr:hypothetical protein OPIT5_08250 [Opitutaceae bacterium TAV5]
MKLTLSNDLVYTVCRKCARDLYSFRLARLNLLHDPQCAALGEYDRERGEHARDAIRGLLQSAESTDDRRMLHIYLRENLRFYRIQGDVPARWQDQTSRVLLAHPDHVSARTLNKLNGSIAAGTWTPATTATLAA